MRINLKLLRVKQGLTQDEMAEKIGVSRLTYNQIERGERGGSVERFWDRVQEIFDIPDSEMYELMKKDD